MSTSNPDSDIFDHGAGSAQQPLPVRVILVLSVGGWLMVIGLITVLNWVYQSIT